MKNRIAFPGFRTAASALVLGFVLVACGGGDTGRFAFGLSLVGLPDSDGMTGHYEAWVVSQGTARSAGKFVVLGVGPGAVVMNPARTLTYGNATSATFGPTSTQLGELFPRITAATHLFITLEPEGDTNRIPTCQVLLAGVVVGQEALLTPEGVAVPMGFPCAVADGLGGFRLGLGDFSAISGVYQLRSPTNDAPTQPDDDFAGVWFVRDGATPGSLAAGLVLPTLPGELRYEGWAVVDGTPRSLGRFVSASGKDEDAAVALQRGAGPGLPFPGQDFVLDFMPAFAFDPPALDLTTTQFSPDGDYDVLVTIEPFPDNDLAPFQLPVFAAVIPPTAVGANGNASQAVQLTPLPSPLPEADLTLATGAATLADLGLQDLGAGISDRRGHFELWLQTANGVESVGRFLISGADVFSVDSEQIIGTTASVTFTAANTGNPVFPDTATATEGFITFECEDDADASPSARVILQGEVLGGLATLTVTGASATGGRGLADLTALVGRFVLDTPTDDASGVPANDRMGILFGTLTRAQSLTIPVLPVGWRYEGFVVEAASGRAFSTGKFRLANTSDENDGVSLSRGARRKPGLPGEDFLFDVSTSFLNAAVAGSITEVFVTIEAQPDPAPGPSFLRILEAQVPSGASASAIGGGDLPLTPVFLGGAVLSAQMIYDGD